MFRFVEIRSIWQILVLDLLLCAPLRSRLRRRLPGAVPGISPCVRTLRLRLVDSGGGNYGLLVGCQGASTRAILPGASDFFFPGCLSWIRFHFTLLHFDFACGIPAGFRRSKLRHLASVKALSEGVSETTADLAFLVAVAISLFGQRELLFKMDPVTASAALYGMNPFREAVKIAEYLRGHSDASSRIAVLGPSPKFTSMPTGTPQLDISTPML